VHNYTPLACKKITQFEFYMKEKSHKKCVVGYCVFKKEVLEKFNRYVVEEQQATT
jgi:hypothetical protein